MREIYVYARAYTHTYTQGTNKLSEFAARRGSAPRAVCISAILQAECQPLAFKMIFVFPLYHKSHRTQSRILSLSLSFALSLFPVSRHTIADTVAGNILRIFAAEMYAGDFGISRPRALRHGN